MLRLLVVPALVAASVTGAFAQTIVINPTNKQPMLSAPAVEQIRISVSVSTFVSTPADDSGDQALKAQEDGRRLVYEVAGRECAILRDVLASDCRLEGININVQRVPANQNMSQPKVEGFNISGNISLRIVQK